MAKSAKQAIAASKARNKLNRATKKQPEHVVERAKRLLREADSPNAMRLHGGIERPPMSEAERVGLKMGFAVVLAKTKLSDGVDRKADWGIRRETLMEIVGDIGWCNTIHVLSSCLRLWAEVEGIVPVDEDHKKIAHDLAAAVSAVSHQFRLLDDAARKPGKAPR